MDCRYEEHYSIKSFEGTYFLFIGQPNITLPDGGMAYSQDRVIAFDTLRGAINYLYGIINL